MTYSDSKGIKTRQWFANGLLRGDDINRIGTEVYQNTVDTLMSLSIYDSGSEVFKGLQLEHSATFTCTLRSGVALSTQGAYLTLGSWGFVADAEKAFAVNVPVDTAVVFDNASGMVDDRIDSLEIRPVQVNIDSLARKFRDPITGGVSTSVVPTGIEYSFEYAIRKGTEAASPLGPVQTAGWIKVAEVRIRVGSSAITPSDILGASSSSLWTTSTGATKNRVQTSPTDTTANALMKVGAFGLGATVQGVDDSAEFSGRISFRVLDALSPFGGGANGRATVIETAALTLNRGGQIAILDNPGSISPSAMRVAARLRNSDGALMPWVELYHSGNYPSDTAWTTTTTLLNGWTGTVSYIKRAGMVTVTAKVDGTAATSPSILQLPVPYRPGVVQDFAVSADANRFGELLTTGFFRMTGSSSENRASITYPVIT